MPLKRLNPDREWVVVAVLVALVLLAGGLYALISPPVQAQPPQVSAFSHQKHVEAGAQCVFCHAGVLNGPVAGLPSVAKCMGCHQNVQVRDEKDQPDVDALARMWEAGQPLRWARVNDQPDFVYFSHRPHVNSGVSCETCHGDVSHMDITRPVYNLNMQSGPNHRSTATTWISPGLCTTSTWASAWIAIAGKFPRRWSA